MPQLDLTLYASLASVLLGFSGLALLLVTEGLLLVTLLRRSRRLLATTTSFQETAVPFGYGPTRDRST